MSLQVYMYRSQVPRPRRITSDIEDLFGTLPFTQDAYTLSAFKNIDGGSIIKDHLAVSGLTGTTMSVYDMSTGCKAACCVPKTDMVVSLKEAGINARDFILAHCRVGAIVLDKDHGYRGTCYDSEDVPEIDVLFGIRHITSIDTLNYLLDGDVFDNEDFYFPKA